MTTRLAGGIAAAAFAVGALVAAAAIVLAQAATVGTEYMDAMARERTGMTGHMNGADMDSMMGMPTMDRTDGSMMGPGPSTMRRPSGMTQSEHQSHHATPEPVGPR